MTTAENRTADDRAADEWLAHSRELLSRTSLAPEAVSVGRVERIAPPALCIGPRLAPVGLAG